MYVDWQYRWPLLSRYVEELIVVKAAVTAAATTLFRSSGSDISLSMAQRLGDDFFWMPRLYMR